MENFRINERKYAPKYSLGYDDKNCRWRLELFNEQTLFYEWMADSFDSEIEAQSHLDTLLEENKYQCIYAEKQVQVGKWQKISECSHHEMDEIKPLIKSNLSLCDTEKSVVGYSIDNDILAVILVQKNNLREYLLSTHKDAIFPDYMDVNNTYEIVDYYEKRDYGIDLFNAAYLLEDRVISNDPIMWVSDDKKFFRSESLYHLGFYQWQVDEVIMKQLD